MEQGDGFCDSATATPAGSDTTASPHPANLIISKKFRKMEKIKNRAKYAPKSAQYPLLSPLQVH